MPVEKVPDSETTVPLPFEKPGVVLYSIPLGVTEVQPTPVKFPPKTALDAVIEVLVGVVMVV